MPCFKMEKDDTKWPQDHSHSLLGEQQGPFSLPAPTWTLPSWPAEPRVMPSWSQPHAVTPQIKEDPPDGFCKRWNLMNPWRIMLRKDTSCFIGELLHSFLPDSSEGLSFPWLIAPVPFGKGEFVSLTVPQWQRLILDVTRAWCSRVRNKEARSEHVFSQGSSSFVAGRWRRSAQCCCFSDLQLALGTVLTREHVETEETSLSSPYSSVCSLQGGFSAWLWEDLLGT